MQTARLVKISKKEILDTNEISRFTGDSKFNKIYSREELADIITRLKLLEIAQFGESFQ